MSDNGTGNTQVGHPPELGDNIPGNLAADCEAIDWSPLVERLKALSLEGGLEGFLLITNDSFGDVVQSDRTEILFGKDFLTEEILGLKFRISPFSFFQTNTKGAEVLYQRARDYILENATDAESDQIIDLHDKVVFDLYSGTGTIAQIIAPVVKKVIGVEIVAEAVEAARENAKENGLTNCEFIVGDVLKVMDEITEKPDFIILDPPRDGIHPKALRKIIEYGVENIVYISCKPTSFARDLVVFQECGYELRRVSNVDMFPETVHVETCALLSHKKADSQIEVKMDYSALDVEQKPSKVTYKMIQNYVEKKYKFKVHTAYIAEVKRDLGLPMYDAPNAVKELKQPKRHPTPEKVDAIKDALSYFGVI